MGTCILCSQALTEENPESTEAPLTHKTCLSAHRQYQRDQLISETTTKEPVLWAVMLHVQGHINVKTYLVMARDISEAEVTAVTTATNKYQSSKITVDCLNVVEYNCLTD